MDTRTLLDHLNEALTQAETIPDPPNTTSKRNWLTANQKKWTIHYIEQAIAELEKVTRENVELMDENSKALTEKSRLQDCLKATMFAHIKHHKRWLLWQEESQRWVVKWEHTDVEGSKRITVLIKTEDFDEAVQKLFS